MCQAFSLFLLVCEKTHPKDGQWKIFVVASDVNMSREKYFEFRKSLTHFDALISDDHFGQMGNSRKNKSRVFGLETFSEFSHLSKILVNTLTLLANQTQRSIPMGSSVDKKTIGIPTEALSVTVIL